MQKLRIKNFLTRIEWSKSWIELELERKSMNLKCFKVDLQLKPNSKITIEIRMELQEWNAITTKEIEITNENWNLDLLYLSTNFLSLKAN